MRLISFRRFKKNCSYIRYNRREEEQVEETPCMLGYTIDSYIKLRTPVCSELGGSKCTEKDCQVMQKCKELKYNPMLQMYKDNNKYEKNYDLTRIENG